ncbi:MAG: dephospho-CoA kinase [Ignavibacteriales bacterium]|nr:dephospho-CoA kinase [Ignavibacteriales bacterium]
MNRNKKIFNTLAVGVTGGIGSGKSKVCQFFSSLGAIYLQADRIAQMVMESDPEVIRKVKLLLGSEAYLSNGSLNKSLIASKIFSNHDEKKQIDGAVHPAVLKLIAKEITDAKNEKTSPLILVEAALIFEANSESMYDYVIVVDAPKKTRVRWLHKRDGSDTTEIISKMKSQLSDKEKLSRADFVIKNSGTISQLEDQSRFIFNLLTSISRTKVS